MTYRFYILLLFFFLYLTFKINKKCTFKLCIIYCFEIIFRQIDILFSIFFVMGDFTLGDHLKPRTMINIYNDL